MKFLFLVVLGILLVATHSCGESTVTAEPINKENQQFIEMLDSMTTVHANVLNAIDSTHNDSFAASR